jgi:hypothetical protein
VHAFVVVGFALRFSLRRKKMLTAVSPSHGASDLLFLVVVHLI